MNTSSASKRNVLRHFNRHNRNATGICPPNPLQCVPRRDPRYAELKVPEDANIMECGVDGCGYWNVFKANSVVNANCVARKAHGTSQTTAPVPQFGGGTAMGQPDRHKRQQTEKRIAIYVIVRKLTLKIVYVGKTCDVARRFQQHASYTSQCRLLREAFLKEGRHNFEIKPLMFCSESDADKNESTMIAKLNTIHPSGLNLRCGSRAGVEETDASLTTIDNNCTDVVQFENVSDESDATAQGWADVAQMLKDGDDGQSVDGVCKKYLKLVHPDVSKQDTFSAAEVAAIVNDIRKTQK